MFGNTVVVNFGHIRSKSFSNIKERAEFALKFLSEYQAFQKFCSSENFKFFLKFWEKFLRNLEIFDGKVSERCIYYGVGLSCEYS